MEKEFPSATYIDNEHIVPFGSYTWKHAFGIKALQFSGPFPGSTFGYKVSWYLWSADIWYGRFPLMKTIVAVNVLLWFLLLR